MVRRIYCTVERNEKEKVSSISHKIVMVAARGPRNQNSSGAIERTGCFRCEYLLHKKVCCPNRDTTKTGNGCEKKVIIHNKTGGDGNGLKPTVMLNASNGEKKQKQRGQPLQLPRQRTPQSVAYGIWTTT